MMNNEFVTMITKIVLIIISMLLTTYVIPWIKSKMANEKYNELILFIGKCVGAAEKLYTPEEWKAKKEYVLKLAESKMMSLGIVITSDELNSLIEGMVYSVKEK